MMAVRIPALAFALFVGQVAAGLPAKPSLEVVGDSLVYRDEGQMRVIKRLPDRTFQGFAIVDHDRVFLAYSGDGEGGASTILAVSDLKSGHELFIWELGATGDTTFVYSKDNGLVAFNWCDGLYVFSIKEVLEQRSRPAFDLERFLTKVASCASCDEVQWKGVDLLSYLQWDGRGPKRREIKLPHHKR